MLLYRKRSLKPCTNRKWNGTDRIWYNIYNYISPQNQLLSLTVTFISRIIIWNIYFFTSAARPPFGQMPFLVLPDGKILAQSFAICKFVCALGGELAQLLGAQLSVESQESPQAVWLGCLWTHTNKVINGLPLPGFCPSDAVERAQADMVFYAVAELNAPMTNIYFEKDEAKKVGN